MRPPLCRNVSIYPREHSIGKVSSKNALKDEEWRKKKEERWISFFPLVNENVLGVNFLWASDDLGYPKMDHFYQFFVKELIIGR